MPGALCTWGPSGGWWVRADKGALLIITQPPGSQPTPRLLGVTAPGWWGALEAGLAEPCPCRWALSRGPGLVRSLPLYTGCQCGAHSRAARDPVCPQLAAGDLRLLPHADTHSGNAGEGSGNQGGLSGQPGALTEAAEQWEAQEGSEVGRGPHGVNRAGLMHSRMQGRVAFDGNRLLQDP